MNLFRLVSDYRWPIYIGGHLTMSIVACGARVVATRPGRAASDRGLLRSCRIVDVDETVQDASRQLGWTVRYELPGVPHYPGMPQPVDVSVVDRDGKPVDGLAGQLMAIRPSDGRLNQRGNLVAIPSTPGGYRTPRASLTNPGCGSSASIPNNRRCLCTPLARDVARRRRPYGGSGAMTLAPAPAVAPRPREPAPTSRHTAGSRFRRVSCACAGRAAVLLPGLGRSHAVREWGLTSTPSRRSAAGFARTGASPDATSKISRPATRQRRARRSVTTVSTRLYLEGVLRGVRAWLVEKCPRCCRVSTQCA